MKKSNMHKTPSLYNAYSSVIKFIAIRGSKRAIVVNEDTIKLTNVKKPFVPEALVNTFDTVNFFRVYINGDFIKPEFYTHEYNGSIKEITFKFNGLRFILEESDEITVTGKFQEL
jgi:hypothetical protein